MFVLTLISYTSTSVALSWTDISNNNCIPISSYNIYQNGILIETQPYTITSTTINNLSSGTTYNFYITSVSTNIQSEQSNQINITI